MKANNFTYEVIFVNDGSTDRSWDVIRELSEKSENVRGIKFRRNYGKSPALYCGFNEAKGDVVITMDADLQYSPDEIPELYRMIVEDGYDPYLVISRTASRVTLFQRQSLQNSSMLRHVR